ncbi:MAG TPA: hypothetical protein DIU00_16745, partial [Phycisphaerales bacterium]|nr:hypothetical protein [Phycisphaerales bacterium]
VITVGNETLTFVRQPTAGYVLKTQNDISSMDTVCRFLKSDGDVKINPIRGLGRKGVSVIYNERPAEENDRTIKSLRFYNEVQYTAPLFSSNGETVAIIPEIVIRVKPDTTTEHVQAICEMTGCSIIKQMEFTEQEYLLQVSGPNAEAVFEAAGQLNRIDWIEWACPNTAFEPKLCGQVIPNDEYFSELWHLHNTGQISLYGAEGTPNIDINAPEAWEITTGDPNIVVAVIDNGVDSKHPDLINNLVPGYDFRDDDDLSDPSAEYFGNNHGTACAGLIAAQGNNGIGVAGVTWNCSIMPIRIRGGGDTATLSIESDIATAYRWAAVHGADILSNSWGYVAPVPIIHSAIVDITEIGGIGRSGKGCVVLAVVGNDGGVLQWPARYAEVIAVGATDNADIRHEYSNYGEELDIMAHGSAGDLNSLGRGTLCTTDISGSRGQNNKWGTLLYGPLVDIDVDYAYMGGTSSACPVAAGVAALILSVDPNLTNEEVKQILYRSAKDLGDPGWDVCV